MRRYWLLLCITVAVMSCDGSNPIDLQPVRYPRKALLEMASQTGRICIEADTAAAGIVQREEYRNAVFVLSFHVGDDLAMSIQKGSALLPFKELFLDDILANLSVIPVGAVGREVLPDAYSNLFVPCDRWETEVEKLLPPQEGEWTSPYGLKMETLRDGNSISSQVTVGFGEIPADEFCLTLFLVEDGILQESTKPPDNHEYNWVVRGMLKGPDDAFHPFGYPLSGVISKGGQELRWDFAVSLDAAEIACAAPENLKIVAVLHEAWYPNPEGDGLLPGRLVNVQQANLGENVGWN